MNDSKPKRGRPIGYRKENAFESTLPKVRVTRSQLEKYVAHARSSGLSTSAWIRDALDRAILEKPRKK